MTKSTALEKRLRKLFEKRQEVGVTGAVQWVPDLGWRVTADEDMEPGVPFCLAGSLDDGGLAIMQLTPIVETAYPKGATFTAALTSLSLDYPAQDPGL